MSSTSVELELATKTPLPGSVSVLSVYSESQPNILDEQANYDIELVEEIAHESGHTTHSNSMHSLSTSPSMANVSSLPPVDKGRKAWQFVRSQSYT